jgi:ribosomal protein S27AE
VAYIVIAICFGFATAIIGRAKGSSFFIWLMVGLVLNVFGLIAVILFRREDEELQRRCPRCGNVEKLYAQVCSRCGEDLYLPDRAEIRDPVTGRVARER